MMRMPKTVNTLKEEVDNLSEKERQHDSFKKEAIEVKLEDDEKCEANETKEN